MGLVVSLKIVRHHLNIFMDDLLLVRVEWKLESRKEQLLWMQMVTSGPILMEVLILKWKIYLTSVWGERMVKVCPILASQRLN